MRIISALTSIPLGLTTVHRLTVTWSSLSIYMFLNQVSRGCVSSLQYLMSHETPHSLGIMPPSLAEGALQRKVTSNSTSSGRLNRVLILLSNSAMPSGPGFTLIRCTAFPRVTTMTGSAGRAACGLVSVPFQSGSCSLQNLQNRSSLQENRVPLVTGIWWAS